jgi:hypothetical protein
LPISTFTGIHNHSISMFRLFVRQSVAMSAFALFLIAGISTRGVQAQALPTLYEQGQGVYVDGFASVNVGAAGEGQPLWGRLAFRPTDELHVAVGGATDRLVYAEAGFTQRFGLGETDRPWRLQVVGRVADRGVTSVIGETSVFRAIGVTDWLRLYPSAVLHVSDRHPVDGYLALPIRFSIAPNAHLNIVVPVFGTSYGAVGAGVRF